MKVLPVVMLIVWSVVGTIHTLALVKDPSRAASWLFLAGALCFLTVNLIKIFSPERRSAGSDS